MVSSLALSAALLLAAEKPCGKDMTWRAVTGVLWDLRGLKGSGRLNKGLSAELESGGLDGSEPVLAEKSGKQWLIVNGWPNVGHNWPSPWLEARYTKVRLSACAMPGKSSATLFSPGEPIVLDKRP